MPGPRRRMRRRAVVGGAMIANHRADEQQAQYEQQQPQYEQQPAAPVEAVPAAPSMDQKIHDIDELAKLRDSGALTEEEFAQQKQQILDS